MTIPPLPMASAADDLATLAPPDHPRIETGQSDSRLPSVGKLPKLNSAPEVFHIPCPNGHVLETPAELIGQYAKCPECDVAFDLREEHSEEYLRRQQIAEESHLARLDRRWLNRAIVIVMLVCLGLIGLAIATFLSQ